MLKELEELILHVHRNSWTEVEVILDSALMLVIHSGQPWNDDDDELGDFSSQSLVNDRHHCCFRETKMWSGERIGYNDYGLSDENFARFCIDQEELILKIEEHLVEF